MAENPLCPKTERERDEARAALSACQEELARVRAELARLRGGVGPAADERISLTNRAEAAEAEVKRLRGDLIDLEGQLGRAEAAEADQEKWRQEWKAAEAARDELARVGHRVLILDDAEPGEDSEAHVAVIGELRAALSLEATKGDAE